MGVKGSLRFVILSEAKNPRPFWYERLRLSDFIICPVRAAPGRTSSGRRSSPEVLWPDGINYSSFAWFELIVQLIKLRANYDASAETCKRVRFTDFFGLAAAIKTRRYGLGAEMSRDLF